MESTHLQALQAMVVRLGSLSLLSMELEMLYLYSLKAKRTYRQVSVCTIMTFGMAYSASLHSMTQWFVSF